MRCMLRQCMSALAALAAWSRITLISAGSASYFFLLNITSQKLFDMW